MRTSKPLGAPDEISLKIYGERNTGTNYLAELAQHNLRARILPGRVDDGNLRTALTRRLHRLMPGLTHGLHEAARDRYFEATFSDNLGWKHMNPDPARIGPDALASVRFLMVVKNPYAWLLSLYQRPYHVGAQDTRFEEFLARRLTVMQRRENIGPDPLRPVEVWNRKMQGYMTLRREAAHAVIARYEDFLSNEAATLEGLADALGIPMRDRYVPVSEGVKRADVEISHTDYAAYYLNEQWREKLSREALEIINPMLDQDIVAELGYEMIDPASLEA